MSDETTTSYDEIPYDSQPVPRTHPEHLAVVSKLFGLESTAPNKCRLLELGCANGRNLFGLATALPESYFVGIDLSNVQISEGQMIRETTELNNLKLEQLSILEIDKNFGTFDYIICHGIFSWVPHEVQNKILEICSNNLAENGVAFISYNTYPGWHIRGTIRDIMLYEAERFDKPSEKILAARRTANFLAETITGIDSYEATFKAELDKIRRLPDWYMFHDLLEEHNEPVYFHEFMDRAGSNSLQYLCDAEVPKITPQEFPRKIEQAINRLSSDIIQKEQYLDFLRNRMFRRTLLVHDQVPLVRQISPEIVPSYRIASRMQPVSTNPSLTKDGVEEQFKHPNGGLLRTAMPLAKAGLTYLSEAWPRSIPYDDLLAAAMTKLNPRDNETVSLPSEEATAFSSVLLRAYLADLVEFHLIESVCAAIPEEHPRVSSLARFEASRGKSITNLHNERVTVSPFDQSLLTLMDGNYNFAGLCKEMEGRNIPAENQSSTSDDVSEEQNPVSRAVQESLSRMAKNALLLP